ncbi:MAG: PAS domain S-box protein [Rhodocyclaceae bacterium]|nr:PAS domain S-box protein [Rhodocyclaceae bacterium]
MSNLPSRFNVCSSVQSESNMRALAHTCGADTSRQEVGMHVRDIAELVDGVVVQLRTLANGKQESFFISDNCEGIWGYTSAELIAGGTGFLRGADAATQDLLVRSMDETIKMGVLWKREWSIRDRSGCMKWLRGIGKPKLAAGGLAVWSLVVTDITSGGSVEKFDESRRSNFRMLCDRLEDVAVHRFGEDLRVTYWNQASARVYGYSEAEAIGREVVELVAHPEHHEEWRKRFAEILSSRRGFTPFQAWRKRRDGSRIEVRGSVVLMEFPEKPLEFVCLDHDLSPKHKLDQERSVLEEQLRQSQKLEALGTLAGGVAHDFNNILAAILGNTRLGLLDAAGNEEVMTSLNEIRRAGHRAKDLVQRILSFSRRCPPSRKVVDMADLVNEAVTLLRATAPKSIEIDVRIDTETPLVYVDPSQLHQVILNLCTNAVHAISDLDHGMLQISVSTCSALAVEAAAPGELVLITDPEDWPRENVCICVRDNGCGMDTTTLTRLFEPFFTTKPVGEGTGLGMSVVHGILRDHQAAIRVTSKPGEGSSFNVILRPAESQNADIAETEIVVEEQFDDGVLTRLKRETTILHVDDDELIGSMVARMLKKAGFPSHHYLHPKKALDDVCSGAIGYDLAILDFSMPDLDGLSLAKELLRLHPGKPVVITTGFISDDLRTNAPIVGVSELIPKPNTGTQLLKSIERLALQLAQSRESGEFQSKRLPDSSPQAPCSAHRVVRFETAVGCMPKDTCNGRYRAR